MDYGSEEGRRGPPSFMLSQRGGPTFMFGVAPAAGGAPIIHQHIDWGHLPQVRCKVWGLGPGQSKDFASQVSKSQGPLAEQKSWESDPRPSVLPSPHSLIPAPAPRPPAPHYPAPSLPRLISASPLFLLRAAPACVMKVIWVGGMWEGSPPGGAHKARRGRFGGGLDLCDLCPCVQQGGFPAFRGPFLLPSALRSLLAS